MYLCDCISISKQCSVLCDICKMDICTCEAANFSLKNDCFGRVVLCCFACCCCVALSFSPSLEMIVHDCLLFEEHIVLDGPYLWLTVKTVCMYVWIYTSGNTCRSFYT